jgi:hypothetical protein
MSVLIIYMYRHYMVIVPVDNLLCNLTTFLPIIALMFTVTIVGVSTRNLYPNLRVLNVGTISTNTLRITSVNLIGTSARYV